MPLVGLCAGSQYASSVYSTVTATCCCSAVVTRCAVGACFAADACVAADATAADILG